MESVARVYAEALFETARERNKLDVIHEQLVQFTDVLESERELQTFFFSPYFSSAEKSEALDSAITGGEEELVSFLNLLVEKHRMPALFRIRRRFGELWAEENRRLEVTVTSAVALDPEVVENLGAEIGRQTKRSIDLTTEVDDNIIGGLVVKVGNMVLDASLRTKLENLRREITQPV